SDFTGPAHFRNDLADAEHARHDLFQAAIDRRLPKAAAGCAFGNARAKQRENALMFASGPPGIMQADRYLTVMVSDRRFTREPLFPELRGGGGPQSSPRRPGASKRPPRSC